MGSNLAKPAYVLWWVITLAWAGQIFYLSTHTFSPEFSQGLLALALNFFHFKVSPGTFDILHTALRKLAHLTEYAILALLLFYGPLGGGSRGFWQPRRAAICIAVAAAYSLTDEFHQSFVPGRHASLGDCGLDTIGAMLAMLLPYTLQQIAFWGSHDKSI